MAFYNEKCCIVTDSLGNIYNLEWRQGTITGFFFDRVNGKMKKSEIVNGILEGYDIAIKKDDCIYIVYQGKDNHLYLSNIFKDDNEVIQITKSPMPNIYNLNLLLDGDDIHIFYEILIDKKKKIYRIYHHHYNNNHWNTNIVEEIKILNILNPLSIIFNTDKLYLVFYDIVEVENEEIFIKEYNFFEQIWSDKIRLTYDSSSKLYLDTLIEKDTLHLAYSKYIEGNLAITYEKFKLTNNNFNNVKKSLLSNIENSSYPTLIKYQDKLWIIWLEYENLLSRYSMDNGQEWSSIYLWEESKSIDFVRYKYVEFFKNDVNKRLNYSFGKVHPDISFLGFGPLDNIIEIPLKKKNMMISNIPRI